MSDAATEALYESNLRRCADEGHPRLFFFKVGNAEVAVCPRCEVRFIEDITAGDGSEWDQQVRAAKEEFEQSLARHPAGSASGTIRCCKPRRLVSPSGAYLAHSRFCKEHPGERISAREYAQGRTGMPRVRTLRG